MERAAASNDVATFATLLERTPSIDALQFARRLVTELNEREKKKKQTEGSGFLFLCNNMTERECLEKNLFGLPAREFEAMQRSICPTTKLFLYNTQVPSSTLNRANIFA
jgi:hypothetical protein